MLPRIKGRRCRYLFVDVFFNSKNSGYALKHFESFNAEHPEYVFPKIHNVAYKSSPVSYGISLFPKVIEKLRSENIMVNVYILKIRDESFQ